MRCEKITERVNSWQTIEVNRCIPPFPVYDVNGTDVIGGCCRITYYSAAGLSLPFPGLSFQSCLCEIQTFNCEIFVLKSYKKYHKSYVNVTKDVE